MSDPERMSVSKIMLSSPRAESDRAVTGRRCPHSGEGEDLLTRQPGFFYENDSETKSQKIEMNRLSEGYKRAVFFYENDSETKSQKIEMNRLSEGYKRAVFFTKMTQKQKVKKLK